MYKRRGQGFWKCLSSAGVLPGCLHTFWVKAAALWAVCGMDVHGDSTGSTNCHFKRLLSGTNVGVSSRIGTVCGVTSACLCLFHWSKRRLHLLHSSSLLFLSLPVLAFIFE